MPLARPQRLLRRPPGSDVPQQDDAFVPASLMNVIAPRASSAMSPSPIELTIW
jgi:hypothetical protein